MEWLTIQNNKPIPVDTIPIRTDAVFREELLDYWNKGFRVVGHWGRESPEEAGTIIITTVLANDSHSNMKIACQKTAKEGTIPSLTPTIPSFHLFERELFEQFSIFPENHPWLKPVRSPPKNGISAEMDAYPFFSMEGKELHEVGVGPVHAGVIEPGHFRFICEGERVLHLEIQLGWQHRGIERMFTLGDPMKLGPLAENIVGDSATAYATVYSQLIEALGETEVSKRALAVRGIALELERIGMHIGDLGMIANDIAYLSGNAIFGAMRTKVINTLLSICGSRFGKSLSRPGGVMYDIDERLSVKIRGTLASVLKDVILMGEEMFGNPLVLARLEKTGLIESHVAREIGMVGFTGRASSQQTDVRSNHPYGIYRHFPIYIHAMDEGDVFSRSYLRFVEIQQSIRFILEILDYFPSNDLLCDPPKKLLPRHFCVSMVEAWRGETAHAAVTGDNGEFVWYRIKDPSFHNWFALALAVRNNGISDFPLCNKSFNLSYAGFDL